MKLHRHKLAAVLLMLSASLTSTSLTSCQSSDSNKDNASTQEYEWSDGEVISFTSTVEEIYRGRSEKSPIKLNLGGNFPDQKLTLVFWKSDLPKFGNDFRLDSLLYEEVTVRGKVSFYNGRPQIVVKEPSQLQSRLLRSVPTPPQTSATRQKERKESLSNTSISILYNSPIDSSPSKEANSPIGKALVNVISGAKKSLDIAIYGIRHQEDVFQAVEEAIARGVKVRLVIDKDVNGKSYYSSTPDFVKLVKKYRDDHKADLRVANMSKPNFGAPYWKAPKGFEGPPQALGFMISEDKALIAVHASRDPFPFAGDIMHNKFVIADSSVVWTGSCNVSDSGTGGYNANIGCVINSKSVALHYLDEFELMYVIGKFHRDKNKKHPESPKRFSIKGVDELTIGFCPQNYVVQNSLIPRIEAATESINVSIFYLTHKYITDALIQAKRRGVKIKVIVDATSAQNGYSKHQLLRAAGINVKTENWGGKMHMKACSIDNRYLVLGSMNWTSAGERKNDENYLLVDSPREAAKYNQFFFKLWNSIPAKCLRDDPDPESLASVGSLTDGMDNDFDELADELDPHIEEEAYNTCKLPPYGWANIKDGYGMINGIKYDLILGVTNGDKPQYVLPNHRSYKRLRKNSSYYFPSIDAAKKAGFKKKYK